MAWSGKGCRYGDDVGSGGWRGRVITLQTDSLPVPQWESFPGYQYLSLAPPVSFSTKPQYGTGEPIAELTIVIESLDVPVS